MDRAGPDWKRRPRDLPDERVGQGTRGLSRVLDQIGGFAQDGRRTQAGRAVDLLHGDPDAIGAGETQLEEVAFFGTFATRGTTDEA